MLQRLTRLVTRRKRTQTIDTLAVELDAFDRETIALAKQYSMTSVQRLQALILATRHICRRQLEGSIVECGVWRGGSMLAVGRTLRQLNAVDRDLYLYDTFEGMPPPSSLDVRHHDQTSAAQLLRIDTREDGNRAIASKETVQYAVGLSGYPTEQIRLIQGKVEDTIPGVIPDRIALLRLDTDWYASTRHELEHLYPRLVPGGVLIIDDYGWWEGARRAVDEYFAKQENPPLLNVIDDTGRIAVKA